MLTTRQAALIALINHPGLKKSKGLQIQTPSPPIGLAYLGAALRSRGHDYTAVDGCGAALDRVRPYAGRDDTWIQGLTVEEIVARVPLDTRVVGFTCLFSHCWPLVASIARALRPRLPDALFVAGGEHPTALPSSVLGPDGVFDVVVRGEGEETFVELVERRLAGEPWRDVAGIVWRRGDGALAESPARRRIGAIDELPWPDWDRWCIDAYIAAQQVTGVNLGRAIPILGSRGCPYRCSFCSNEQMWTRRYVMRDPVALVDEMAEMQRRYGVSSFTFMDSTFVINRAKTLAFCRELVRRGLGVTYQLPAGTRCEAFDAELVEALEASGLRNFAFAPESGSADVRQRIHKQMDLPGFLEAVRLVLRTRMTVGCFFVVGFPEDTPASLRETLRLVRRLAWLGVHDVTVSSFTPYPGSEHFDRLVASGAISGDLERVGDGIDFFGERDHCYAPGLSGRELHRFQRRAFLNFYLISFLARPWRLVRNVWLFATRGVEAARYVRFLSELTVTRRRWRSRNAGSGRAAVLPRVQGESL